MEDRLTVRLPRDLSKALRERAARMQRKPSEVVHMVVTKFLQRAEQDGSSSRRVRNLTGSVQSGVPDLAIRHRHYIVKKLRLDW